MSDLEEEELRLIQQDRRYFWEACIKALIARRAACENDVNIAVRLADRLRDAWDARFANDAK